MLLSNAVRLNGGFKPACGTSANIAALGAIVNAGSRRNLAFGQGRVSGVTNKAAVPEGYLHPYCVDMPQKSGGMASRNRIAGSGDASFANLAGGLNGQAGLTGSGDISDAALGLIVALVSSITGQGSLTADIIGKLEAVASLAGSGSLSSALGALAGLAAGLTGSASVAGSSTAKASISADITVTGDLLNTANVAAAVWGALASAFNDAGTMGEKLNDAGAAGDPWSTALPGAYAAGTAGKIIGERIEQTIVANGGSGLLDMVVDGNYTLKQVLQVIAAAVAGKVNGGPASPVFKSLDGVTTRITGVADSNGNRTSVTYTPDED